MKNIELIDKAINDLKGKWSVDGGFQDGYFIIGDSLILSDVSGTHGCKPYGLVEKRDFLARKAERQNKPDWSEHNYRFICQGKNGLWYGSQKENPPQLPFYLTGDDWYFIPAASGGNGEVFGCYHDTLEQRPDHIGEANEKAVTESDCPDEKRIDVVATNGNDGLHYAAKSPEFKHGSGVLNVVDDNDWHSRGELPPMGDECEYTIGDNFGGFKPCHFVGLNSRGSLVVEGADGMLKQFHKHQINLRPLRTEREKFIDAAMLIAGGMLQGAGAKVVFGCMYDAGFRQPDTKA